MDKTTKKYAGLALAGLAIAGAAGVGGHLAYPKTIIKELPPKIEKVENPLNLQLQAQLDETQTELDALKNAPVKTETKTVYVDNDNLAVVEQFLIDHKGNIEFVTEDLDDNEASLVAGLVIKANDFQDLAINKVRDAGIRELHNENVSNIDLDKDDIKSFKVDDDEASFDVLDLEEGDLDVLVPVSFRQDDDRFEAIFRVRFIDGEFDEIDIESLELKE